MGYFEENPDAEIEVTAKGGSHSKLGLDWTLVPWDALAPVNEILVMGAKKYGKNNWRSISWPENWNHAMHHMISATECTDPKEQLIHLTHAGCRVLFTIATFLAEQEEANGS